jgi:hypothetical protein
MNLLDLVKQKLYKEDPVLLDHLEEQDLSMAAAFSPVFITLFIYQIPLEIATRIFEFFILDGEMALLKVLFKMLDHKRDKMLELTESELQNYLRTNLIVECVQELTIDQLLNY